MLTFNEEDAVPADSPDSWQGIQVQVCDGRIAIAALLIAHTSFFIYLLRLYIRLYDMQSTFWSARLTACHKAERAHTPQGTMLQATYLHALRQAATS